MKKGFDIIGDIHGHADELEELLLHLNYTKNIQGHYNHPERTAIFLGDFIDRGPKQLETLEIVMPMVQHGAALSVMGNHEFNALAYHTKHPQDPDTWLRPHTHKNNSQHKAFLDALADQPQRLREILDFFYSLPLWLDLPELRIVHACWDSGHIQQLNSVTPHNNTLTPETLLAASTEGSPTYNAIETTLKGSELELPTGTNFKDKDNHIRSAVRTQWWRNTTTTLGNITLPPNLLTGKTADIVINETQLTGYKNHEKPVFIGHYWMNGKPKPLQHNVACLDYSVAKEGKLVAYRWDGEQRLKKEHFVHT
jgi:Calcineurin-like phosphoesterase